MVLLGKKTIKSKPTDQILEMWGTKKRLQYTGFMKLCPGKRHAWYETNLGYPVRKELGKVKI